MNLYISQHSRFSHLVYCHGKLEPSQEVAALHISDVRDILRLLIIGGHMELIR